MLKRTSVFILSICALTTLHADIELSSSINDVYHRGTSELAGSITMTATSNDFNGVGEEEPIYIRITLDKLARLSSTLVDQTLEGYLGDPVHLALILGGPNPDYELAAPADTVSIVRWVAGENNIWLRVQRDSSSWVTRPDGSAPPDAENVVSFTLGISARSSAFSQESVADTRKNLPFNTRTPEDTDPTAAVSTLICMDLSESVVETVGIESLIEYDIISFDHNAQVGEGVYTASDSPGISFTSDFRIARAKDRSVEVPVFGASGVNTCLAGATVDEEGFAEVSGTLGFVLNSATDGPYLDTDLVPGSYVTLKVSESANYGFSQFGTRFEGSQGGFESLEDPFTLNGRTLYRTVTLAWTGEVQALISYEMNIETSLQYLLDENPGDVSVEWSFTFLNHESGHDDAPYDGDDQLRRCEPSMFTPVQGSTILGSFNDQITVTRHPEDKAICVGQPASFIVTAEGGGLRYQWFKDDAPLSQENGAELNLGLANAESAGVYHCEISNSCGTVVTDEAVLTVNEDQPCDRTPEDLRMVPHITGFGNGFSTSVVLTNISGQTETATYRVYYDGLPPNTMSVEMEPNGQLTLSMEDAARLGATHMELLETEDTVHMTTIYQSTKEGAGPAHVREVTRFSTRWRLFAGDPSVTWDGVAMVNLGKQPTSVSVVQVDDAGEEIESRSLTDQLLAEGKTITLLSDLFTYRPGVSYEIRASQPLALIALRGNINSDFLWESPAIPLDQ